MLRTRLAVIAFALLIGLCSGSAAGWPAAVPLAAPPAVTSPSNVILIGWDGAQREHLQQCLTRSELPNLAALAAAGTLVDIDVTETTDTKAGWAQILSGYSASVTGVLSNSKFQPIPEGLTIFERLEQHFGAESIATLAVIGKDAHVGNFPPERIKLNAAGNEPVGGIAKGQKKAWRQKLHTGTVVDENGAKFLLTPGGPYYLAQNGMDLFQNGLHQNDAVGARALEVLEQYKDRRFLFFIHFADVDSMGHKFGENSQQYTDALISCDNWLGRVEAQLAELGLADKTALYVTADHGFDEGQRQHKNAPYVFLAANDPQVAGNGTRMDIAPTVMQRLGLDLSQCQPPLSGKPLLSARGS